MSKRERLSLTALWHQQGQIHFPRIGVETLLDQITGFGRENHDDLMDGYTILVMQVQEFVRTNTALTDPSRSKVVMVKGGIVWPMVSERERKMNFKTLENDPYGWNP